MNFSQTASGARGPQYCASQLMNINDAHTTFLWRSLIHIHESGLPLTASAVTVTWMLH